ncbi:MAG: outer membrane beta-barrel protein [Deltaproteobacteria bacterium]|nr:outer membrane beta-barrel protein [Deltaproteobacteria bacterium]
MKKKLVFFLFVFMVSNFGICALTYAGEWRFPVGLSYFSGLDDIGDILEDNETSGYTTADITVIPVGITFRPYYEFENGMGVGMDFGPTMLTTGDIDFFNFPINATFRYSFNHDGNTSPYLRAGVSYNIVSGDYKEGSNPGIFAAAGIELMRTKMIGFGIEVAYDSSEIEMENLDYSRIDEIKPGDLILTFSVIF